MEDFRRPRFPGEKRGFFILVLWILCLLSVPAQADSPIYQGFLWDAAPAAAYNSQKGEFLVVWNVYNPFFPLPDTRFFGPVMGQLIKENGGKIGEPFEIITEGGVLPKVAYNLQTNEYLVVAEQYYNIVGQRVSALGLKVGGPTTYLTNARVPRVLYNSLAGNFLVAGAWWSDTPSCTLQVYTLPVSATGQPQGTAAKVADEGYNYCADGGVYALEYAPLAGGKAPQGRYLLSVARPDVLRMLDSEGKLLRVLYDPAHDIWYDEVPFQQSKVGTPYNIDIAYGLWGGQPAFFLVWGDINQSVPNYGLWTGIWGGIVEASKELYYTTDMASNEVFPLSYAWSHLTFPDVYKQWKPVVKYNHIAGTFVIAWRETPGGDSRDVTNVNHIRVNTSNSYRIPPLANLVVSATGGTENPMLPAIASGGKTSKLLIVWEDYLNILGDIYGIFFDGADRGTSEIGPGPPGNLPVHWRSISAGNLYSLGIRSDGSLWAWGDNTSGQLGLGNQFSRNSPASVAAGSAWSRVSAGQVHSLGIRTDGGLWSWGKNDFGQLGLGEPLQDKPDPTRVGTWLDWSTASAGESHSLGIRSDGSLWAWGRNAYGELGLGDPLQEKHDPQQVGAWNDWRDVCAAHGFSHGTRSDWSCWAWGYNKIGWSLGVGDNKDRHEPTPTMGSGDWLTVDNGGAHALGIKSDHGLWSWGGNGAGQLGLGLGNTDEMVPTPMPGGSDWLAISAGGLHSLGLRLDGSLWAWGNNDRGQLGLGDVLQNRYIPERVGVWSDWISVSAGGNFSLGIRADGSLWAWGGNESGQLGLGDNQERHFPTWVILPNTMIRLPLILKQ